jgi:hypothetical protein
MARMNHLSSDNIPAIDAVAEQFKSWRSNRVNKREPIPAHLWQAAAELCQQHPISHVCRQLRLSCTDLKKRIGKEQRPAIQFMEIGMSSLSDRWQIECSRADGSQLRMSGSSRLAAVEAIVKAFIS